MPQPSCAGLRRLGAELAAEVERIEQTTGEAATAATALAAREPARLELCGSAALLDTFYTRVEQALRRLAPELNGGIPAGPDWHHRMLEDMASTSPACARQC